MNPHELNDRFGLLCHRLYAERIREKPELRDQALAMLRNGIAENGGSLGHRMWLALLEGSWERGEALMLADSADGRLLRSNSPFARLIGITDGGQRLALWRQAKDELLAERDHHC